MIMIFDPPPSFNPLAVRAAWFESPKEVVDV